ncbi:MAG: four helix bundle protein [Anaerolineae bacterium CG_4_9_14_0_8_um_filter_58_9]|nr:MAG: four helix bundle protein [Anaerolineae bacterium CG_4_9_14_0_8_um_filter_58_9]
MSNDSLWKVEAYRLGLFVADIGWYDVTKLVGDKRTIGLSDQLYRSLGSISANVAEGFSRISHKEKAHFYEYSLGSARESRDWYFKARHVLDKQVTIHRIRLLTQIIRLLTTMVPQQRNFKVREEQSPYFTSEDNQPPNKELIESLLKKVPMP